ncbi:MAG TPA: hypothetical protein VHF91_03475 [Acidimicrobiales bacterium]|nr:hypothetical protein [Acidimicrobiales bacterium]
MSNPRSSQPILEERQYSFSDEAESALREHLERRMKQPRFANGRSVRNALERARLRQATGIVANSHSLGKADLMRIEAEDILAGRVFDGDDEEERGGAPEENVQGDRSGNKDGE